MDLNAWIEELKLPCRVETALVYLGAKTVADVLKLERRKIESRQNFGRKSWADLCRALTDHGYTLPPEWTNTRRARKPVDRKPRPTWEEVESALRSVCETDGQVWDALEMLRDLVLERTGPLVECPLCHEPGDHPSIECSSKRITGLGERLMQAQMAALVFGF